MWSYVHDAHTDRQTDTIHVNILITSNWSVALTNGFHYMIEHAITLHNRTCYKTHIQVTRAASSPRLLHAYNIRIAV